MATYRPIDPEQLTPEQRELWDRYMVPEDKSITREFADAQFREIAAFEGVPLPEPSELERWARSRGS
jgi:hypothetical protein